MKKYTRVLFIGDTHCGHYSGLTPKSRHVEVRGAFADIGRQQRKMWNFYKDTLKEIGPVDTMVLNGDGIAGQNYKAGGRQIYEMSRIEQAGICVEVLKEAKAKEYYIVNGTPYHVGHDDDFEKIVSDKLGGKIHGHLMLKVRDTVFDIKHKIGGGKTDSTRVASLVREKIQNVMWAFNDGQPNANVVIRSHIHDFLYAGSDKYLGVILPGMEGFGDIHGVRECSGIIKIGLVWFDVYDNGVFDWNYKVMKFTTEQSGAVIESRIK